MFGNFDKCLLVFRCVFAPHEDFDWVSTSLDLIKMLG